MPSLELKHAVRSLLKRPALTAVVVVTLGLGLGANASILALIDALVLRPFPFRDVDRIVLIPELEEGDGLPLTRETTSPANFLDWKRQTGVFAHLAAFEWWDVNLVGRDEPERVQGFFVSADFFPALGVRPIHGRGFLEEEEIQGAHRRAVVGYGLWQRRFGGDPALVGQTITLDGQPYEVVGIAPPKFDFPTGAEVWAPLAFSPESAARRDARYLTVIGRLAEDRTLEEARAQMAVVADNLLRQHPEANRGRTPRVLTLPQGMMDQGLGPVLSLWQASALLVLAIACANIANLLLARGAERQRDIAVRLAMGAGQWRIVGELLVESGLLALAAVPAALGFAWVSLTVLRTSMPAQIARFVPGWETIDVDGRLLAVTVALALLTAIVFGLVPALQAARPKLSETLKDGGRSATAGRSRSRLRRALVVAEVALALPLLVAAAMGALGAHRFLNGPQGYDPEGVLTMQLALPDAKYKEPEARRQLVDAVLERLHALPGVRSAAAANVMPAFGGNSTRAIEIEGVPPADPTNPPEADYRSTTASLFETLRIPIVAGRGFTGADREASPRVAIVSESFARRFWKEGAAFGRRVRVGDGDWHAVVGVAGDVIHDWFARRNYPTIYVPYSQAPTGFLALVVRTDGDPAALTAPALAALRAVDPHQPAFDVMTMRQVLRQRTIGLQYIAGIMTVFGGLALLLAMVGVYAVMAFMVAQRRHEIGVRIALGATRRDVLRLALGQSGRLTLVGALIGTALAVALGRLMEAGLVGSASADLRLVAGVAGVLLVTALAAGYLPARRAAAVDPIVALRAE